MKILAALLSVALAVPDGGVDGGGDAPFVGDADAGVFQVASAVQPNGDELGPGWWLAPERMQKVGERIVTLENENNRLKSLPPPATWGFWIGMGLGLSLGTAGTVFLVNQVRK